MKTIEGFLPQIKTALAYDGYAHSVEDVAQKLREGAAQLFVLRDGLIITQLDFQPQQKRLRFWIAAGELEDVLELSERVCEWGRAQGCEVAILEGRRGWERVLEAQKWVKAPVITMYRDLSNE